MKVSELIAKAEPKPVARGRNLGLVGWADGYLLVKFRGRDTLYIYGPDIAEHEAEKIVKNPYPDALFTKLRDKHQWKCHKVQAAA